MCALSRLLCIVAAFGLVLLPGERSDARRNPWSRLSHPSLYLPPSVEARSIDGSGNNLSDPEMGAADTMLMREMSSVYADGYGSMGGAARPSPRAVSNAVNAVAESYLCPKGASDYLWQWGQFLDHDLDLTEAAHPAEAADIDVPLGDPQFDPFASGTAIIPFNRSVYAMDSGGVRQQLNQITAWIDASNVYGSSPERAQALRRMDGSGRLRTSAGGFLPFNTEGLPNAGGPDPGLFLAGDVRANEQVGLTALHTLFVREHNRLARALGRAHRSWSGEKIYQLARRIVGAEMQVITYREFLPALLGPGALRPYTGYDDGTDARIRNVFSTAAYRFGHSALSPTLKRLDRRGRAIPQGHLALRDAFFAPERILDEGGIDPLLRGLAKQRCQRIDVYVTEEVRSFLFGPPGSGGLDLASLNIQRGRDHGLPSYNEARRAMGLAAADDFEDITSDPEVQARLASVYADPDEVDLWVGGLAEDRLRRSHLGPLFQAIVVRQFEALRDGDRFFYRRDRLLHHYQWIENVRLSDIIRWNTRIGPELQDDVFQVPRGSEHP